MTADNIEVYYIIPLLKKLRIRRKMKSKRKTATQRERQTTDSASEEENVEGFTQILREIREFRQETARNFDVLKKDISDIKKKIKELDKRMNEAEKIHCQRY